MNNNNNNNNKTLTKKEYDEILKRLHALKRQCAMNNFLLDNEVQNNANTQTNENAKWLNVQAGEQVDQEENQININDTVLLRITYDEDDMVEDTYTLVGESGNSLLHQISVNSPIGEAIFQRYTEEIISYTVNENTFQVEIVEKKLSLKK